jgi:UDP-N-acetylmuramoyl-tripeptide--D-alanyl-D-alanine ligase
MARYVRSDHGGTVAAITGSNGKTTTKELLAAALGRAGGVHKTSGNLNNLIGLPLTLFGWADDAWAAVLEMGMNAPGEIARLTEIAAPDVGLVTNVGPAHLEGLGSVEAVARAKGELYATLAAGAVCVLNVDDPMVREICVPLAGRRLGIFFGTGPGCDVRLVAHAPSASGSRVVLAFDGIETAFELPLTGAHNAMNAAGAAAAAWALGIGPAEIAAGFSRVSIPGGRLRILPGDITVLDDTYNANPASMEAAFAALAQIARGRRVAVLGDMFELGEQASRLHREVGAAAGESGAAEVLALGDHAGEVAAGAREAGAGAEAFANLDALLAALDGSLRSGDWVLVKGSRGMRMERVVEHLHGERA